MAQATILPQPPGIQVPVRGDSGTVGTPTRDVPHTLGLQGLDQTRLVTVPATEVSQFPIIPFSPGKDLAICGQGQ